MSNYRTKKKKKKLAEYEPVNKLHSAAIYFKFDACLTLKKVMLIKAHTDERLGRPYFSSG